MSTEEKVWKELLELFDWYFRIADGDDDYDCGYADGVGQCIINLGKASGEKHGKPYKHEAYKRIMHYTTCEQYWKDYPKPIASYFPAETTRKWKGKI